MFSVFSFTCAATLAISTKSVFGEGELDSFGFKERHVLLDESRLRLFQNADEIRLP